MSVRNEPGFAAICVTFGDAGVDPLGDAVPQTPWSIFDRMMEGLSQHHLKQSEALRWTC